MNCVFLTHQTRGNCFPADVKQNNHVILRECRILNRRSRKTIGRNLWTIGHVFISNPDLLSSHLHISTTDHDQGISRTIERFIQVSSMSQKERVCYVTNGLEQNPVALLCNHWTGKTVFRLKSTSSVPSEPPDMEGRLSVFVSFDLSSRENALAFATHGEAFVAQAAQKGQRKSARNS